MKVVIAGAVLVLLVAAGVLLAMKRRPVKNTAAAAPAALVEELRRDVASLCAIGPRTVFVPGSLARAADFVERELERAGYRVERQTYAMRSWDARVSNLIVEIRGSARPEEIVVIGAHYDTVEETCGADDNASGVAALLALARRHARSHPARTLRFVAFVNEEPPHFQSQEMGSWQYAKRCHDRHETIVAMVSLETLAYYDDGRGSQHYPPPLAAFYPDTANFIAFASNVGSRALLSRCVKAFRTRSQFPIQSAAMPEAIPGIGWSDQWSFWQFGWPAIMVTDTAPYRNPHYHQPDDEPETLDDARLAQVVSGLSGVVDDLSVTVDR